MDFKPKPMLKYITKWPEIKSSIYSADPLYK